MFFSEADGIRQKINEYTRNGKSFLFALNFEKTEGFFVNDPFNQKDVFFEIQGKGNKVKKSIASKISDLRTYPICRDEYYKKFDIVQRGLFAGNSFLTNLTVKTPIQTEMSLSEIFLSSSSPYQLFLPGKFVCFSPERFVKISGNTISTNPMKGTIDGNIPNAKEIILNDFKETAEHNTIVDLLRNDLSMVSENIKVEKFRYIDSIQTYKKNILQVSSEITGTLPINYRNHLGDIICDLLPAGSISGAPKTSTLDIIRSAEVEPRGYYTGIFGYFDGTDFDSAVMIRFIEQDGKQMFYRSGGGITAYSKPDDEYNEVLDKIYLPLA